MSARSLPATALARLRGSFGVRLGAALTLAFALLAALAYVATATELRAVTVVIALLAVAQLVAVYRLVTRTNRELARLLTAIRYDDASQGFALGHASGSFAELRAAFEEVARHFRKLRLEREAQGRYLEALVEHVPVALLGVGADGQVQLLNGAARRLLDSSRPLSHDELGRYGAAFQRDLAQCRAGQRALTRTELDGVQRHLVLSTTELATSGGRLRLVALQDIQRELDTSELGAWQDMAAVLTHELGSSLTPIASLARTSEELVAELAALPRPPASSHDAGDASAASSRDAVSAASSHDAGAVSAASSYDASAVSAASSYDASAVSAASSHDASAAASAAAAPAGASTTAPRTAGAPSRAAATPTQDAARPSAALSGAPAAELLADLRDATSTLARRADSLTRFVHSYRALTQLPPPQLAPVSLPDYLRRAARLFDSEWRARGVTLTLVPPAPGLSVLADEALLEQALQNLLRNAADAALAAPRPEVWLGARLSERGRAVIEISDNGPGLLAELGEKIYLPFFTTKPHGSGIGLALARQIMLIHQGSISADERPGGGARFRLTF